MKHALLKRIWSRIMSKMKRIFIQKIRGIAALPKSYFSLFTSTFMASVTVMIITETGLLDLWKFTLFFFLSTVFLNSFNNLMDIKSDYITKDNFPLPSGLISPREASLFSAATLIASVITLISIGEINLYAAGVLLIDLLIGFFYSAPKVRLKRYPVIKATMLIMHTAILPLMVGLILANKNFSDYLAVIFPIYIMGLAVHTVQDIGDIVGDVLVGDKTFPSILGKKNSVLLITVLFLFAAVFTWLVFDVSHKVLIMVLFFSQLILSVFLLIRINLWKVVYWSTALTAFVILVLLLVK